jgi:tetratricopeptide (TPR) repeat protein
MGNPWAIAASLNQLGIEAHALGSYDQARAYLQDGLERSRSMEDRASIAFALDGLGLVSASQRNDQETHDFFRASIALWNEIGEQGGLAQTLTHYGDALLRMGDLEGAHKHFLEATEVASRAEITPVVLEALVGEAEVRIARGDTRSGFGIVSSVSQHASGSYATRSRADRLRAELEPHLAAKELETALAAYPTIDTSVRELLGLQA